MKLALLVAATLLAAGCARKQAARMDTSPVFDTQVKNAVRAGDGDAEVQALRQRLMANPGDIALRRRLAAKFDACGYPDLALEHLRIAHEHAPADEELALDLAAKLKDLGMAGQAQRVLGEFVARKQPGGRVLSAAAILKDGDKDFSGGENLHRQALALDPENVQEQNNLAYNLMRQNRAKEAEEMFRRILRAKPSYELARNNLATLYATQLNQPEEALLHWKAISGPAAAHNNLAAVYLDQNRNAEAKAELEKALALRFQFPEAMQNLQIIAARTGGTVDLKLIRDKKNSNLSKLAQAMRHVFMTPEEIDKTKNRRSNP